MGTGKPYKELDNSVSLDRKRLKELLDENGIPASYYSLWNEWEHDTIVLIDNYEAILEIFYMDEKGEKVLLKVCPTEAAACKCIYDYFVNDIYWDNM